MSVSAHNNSRISLLCSDEYEHYEKRAEETYLSIGAELQQIPRAFGYSVCGLMDLERGYKEVSPLQNSLISVGAMRLTEVVYRFWPPGGREDASILGISEGLIYPQ
jgi:hypothetical protein